MKMHAVLTTLDSEHYLAEGELSKCNFSAAERKCNMLCQAAMGRGNADRGVASELLHVVHK
jgi:hypothetical protein